MIAAAARTTGRTVMSCRPPYVAFVMFVMVVLADPVTAGMELATFTTICAATIIKIAAITRAKILLTLGMGDHLHPSRHSKPLVYYGGIFQTWVVFPVCSHTSNARLGLVLFGWFLVFKGCFYFLWNVE